MSDIYDYYSKCFSEAIARAEVSERRIGSELKFPLVDADGHAADYVKVTAFWNYLLERDWKPLVDTMTGNLVGAKHRGPYNDTVVSCETGYCKVEFSLAHAGDIFELENEINKIRKLIREFSEKEKVHFLGYGIQPLTEPSKRLLMKKGRTSVWNKTFSSNRHIDPEDGDDVHLFTINAASHVHVSVSPDEAVNVVNVLNGFAGAQIALTGHSNIWKGIPDPQYKCVSEKMWDWWMGDTGRIGVPMKPFMHLHDYIDTVSEFKPVFVMRAGIPLALTQYASFKEYYSHESATAIDTEGREVSVIPDPTDFDVHSTCYWYNARISRYYTVENRVNDQQPPDDLITIPALTLGLVSAAEESWEELSSLDWNTLRIARNEACKYGLAKNGTGATCKKLAEKMLELAHLGLEKRGRGEEAYLRPLFDRVKNNQSPADAALRMFNDGGIKQLVAKRTI